MKRLLKDPIVSGVAAGGTATVEFPLGPRYFTAWLYYQDGGGAIDILTAIEEIRVLINGKIQRRFTAAEVNAVNLLRGAEYGVQPIAGDDAILPLYFAQPWMRTLQGENDLAFGTGNVASFQLQIDFAAGLTTPSLQVYASIDDAVEPGAQPGTFRKVSLGRIIKTRKINQNVTATGLNVLNSLEKLGDAYEFIHAESANISEVKIYVDNLQVYSATKAMADAYLAQYGMTPVAGSFDIFWDADRQIGSLLQTANNNGQLIQEFRVEFTMSSAASFDILYGVRGFAD